AAGLSVTTLPFVLVTLGLRAAVPAGSPLLPVLVAATPEESLCRHRAWRERYPGTWRSLEVPVQGRWTVWQGSDGPWTHRGAWRHAIDLVVSDDQGGTRRGPGGSCSDYRCWMLPVLAPVAGTVAAVVDGIPDNVPGCVDADGGR